MLCINIIAAFEIITDKLLQTFENGVKHYSAQLTVTRSFSLVGRRRNCKKNQRLVEVLTEIRVKGRREVIQRSEHRWRCTRAHRLRRLRSLPPNRQGKHCALIIHTSTQVCWNVGCFLVAFGLIGIYILFVHFGLRWVPIVVDIYFKYLQQQVPPAYTSV